MDGLILIIARGLEDLRILKLILNLFEVLSGLAINVLKSYLFSTNVKLYRI